MLLSNSKTSFVRIAQSTQFRCSSYCNMQMCFNVAFSLILICKCWKNIYAIWLRFAGNGKGIRSHSYKKNVGAIKSFSKGFVLRSYIYSKNFWQLADQKRWYSYLVYAGNNDSLAHILKQFVINYISGFKRCIGKKTEMMGSSH